PAPRLSCPDVRWTRAGTRAHRRRRTYAPGLGDGRSRRGRLRLDAAWPRSLTDRAGRDLARRAASAEPRLAALIADPGQWDLIEALRAGFARFGVPAQVAQKLPDVDEKDLAPAFAAIRANPQLNWAFVQRGLMVHAVDTLM